MINVAFSHNHQFDQILTLLETGQFDQGIAHLSGLLDAALIDRRDPLQIRNDLRQHRLGMALSHPALADHLQNPGIDAALAARANLAQATFDQALHRGERCIDLGHDPVVAASGQFDLILACTMPDHIQDDHLESFLRAAADRLEPGGRIALSFFIAGHLGCGWQTLWLGQDIHRHAPAAISAAALSAGLTPRLFHDASECLVWAELRKIRTHCNTGNPTCATQPKPSVQ